MAVLDPGVRGFIDEPAIALVAVEPISRPAQAAGSAEDIDGFPLAKGAVFPPDGWIEIHVIGHVEVQIAIEVVIAKSRPRAPPVAADTGPDRGVRKPAIAPVAVKSVGPIIGDVQIRVSIVVVIRRYTTHPPTRVVRRCCRSHVGKAPPACIAVEGIVQRRDMAGSLQSGSIDQIYIEIPIAVVIQKSGPTAFGF